MILSCSEVPIGVSEESLQNIFGKHIIVIDTAQEFSKIMLDLACHNPKFEPCFGKENDASFHFSDCLVNACETYIPSKSNTIKNNGGSWNNPMYLPPLNTIDDNRNTNQKNDTMPLIWIVIICLCITVFICFIVTPIIVNKRKQSLQKSKHNKRKSQTTYSQYSEFDSDPDFMSTHTSTVTVTTDSSR